MTASLIAIDWGTTNRRAYLLDADGQALGEIADDQGLLACQGRFRESLDTLLQTWPELNSDVPVLMSGMVGAASGWQEAPYLDASRPLAELARHLMPLRDMPGRRIAIVPGCCWRGAGERIDVMRGEETQLLGALALGHGDGWYVLPGTHSKWVRLHGGAVAELRTYMTGELFALLSQHGTLASIAGQTGDDVPPEVFLRGLDAAGGAGLSHTLFGCRARVVVGDLPAGHARAYLSGLLIGAEWSDVLRTPEAAPRSVRLIGASHLADRYHIAARHFGCELTLLDPRAVYLAAMCALARDFADVTDVPKEAR